MSKDEKLPQDENENIDKDSEQINLFGESTPDFQAISDIVDENDLIVKNSEDTNENEDEYSQLQEDDIFEQITLDVLENPIVDIEKEVKVVKTNRVQNSVIISFLVAFTTSFFALVRNSFLVYAFTSYNRVQKKFTESYIYNSFSSKDATDRFHRIKKFIRKHTTDSIIANKFRQLSANLLSIPVRIYGFTVLCSGLSTIILYILDYFYFRVFEMGSGQIIGGIAFVLVSIFMIIPQYSLMNAINNSAILSAFFFDVLGIKRTIEQKKKSFKISTSVAFIVGASIGVLTLFFSVISILAAVSIIVISLIVLRNTEAGLIVIILLAPFAPNSLLVYTITVVTVSYLSKVFCGKRTVRLEFIDLLVVSFIFILFLSSDFNNGIMSIILPVLYAFVYLLVIGMVRNTKVFNRCIWAMILVSFFVGVYGVLVMFFNPLLGVNVNQILTVESGNAGDGVIQSSAIIVAVLFMSITFVLAVLFTDNKRAKKFLCLIIIALATAVIVSFASPLALAIFIFSLMIFLLLCNKKAAFVFLVIIALLCLPLLNLVDVKTIAYNEFFNQSRTETWMSYIGILREYWLFGIGSSADTFAQIYSHYFPQTIDPVTDASSLFFSIWLKFGIIGVSIFVMIIFSFLQSAYTYGRDCSNKKDYYRIFIYAIMSGVITILMLGVFENVWYHSRLMLLFWIMVGFSVALKRSAESDDLKNHHYEEVREYF